MSPETHHYDLTQLSPGNLNTQLYEDIVRVALAGTDAFGFVQEESALFATPEMALAVWTAHIHEQIKPHLEMPEDANAEHRAKELDDIHSVVWRELQILDGAGLRRSLGFLLLSQVAAEIDNRVPGLLGHPWRVWATGMYLLV